MEKVRPPAVPDVPVPVLSDDDLRRLFKTCEGKSYADRRDISIMRLFYDTGMRRSELAYLKVSGVDLDEQIAVVMGKGRRPRPARSG
jgi:integrase/recombinase XerC